MPGLGQAVIVKRESRPRISDRSEVGGGAAVEQWVRLVPDQLVPIDGADRGGDAFVERRQLVVERRATGRQDALLPHRSRERLVEQLISEHRLVVCEPRRDVRPGRREPDLQADAAGSGGVGEERVERVLERRVRQVVGRETERRVG